MYNVLETDELIAADPNDVPLHPYPYPQDFITPDMYNLNLFDIDIRHDDLKQMLDSNRDNMKLEAMKRIIGVRKQIALIF